MFVFQSRDALDEDLRAIQVTGDRVAYLKTYAAAFGPLPRAIEPMDTDVAPAPRCASPAPPLAASSSPAYATPAARTPDDRSPVAVPPGAAIAITTGGSATGSQREASADRVKFSRVRTDRLVVDYLLRAGLYKTAESFARAAPHIVCECTSLLLLIALILILIEPLRFTDATCTTSASVLILTIRLYPFANSSCAFAFRVGAHESRYAPISARRRECAANARPVQVSRLVSREPLETQEE